MATKTPSANAYEYSPVAAGPRSRDMTANNTRLDRSATKRETDSQSAFFTTITDLIPVSSARARAAGHMRKGCEAGTNGLTYGPLRSPTTKVKGRISSGWSRNRRGVRDPGNHGAAAGIGNDRISDQGMEGVEKAPHGATDIAVLAPMPGLTRARIRSGGTWGAGAGPAKGTARHREIKLRGTPTKSVRSTRW